MSNKPKIIFIIGMHRCGTSVLTNCLIENGFSIGKNKNTSINWQNPKGYFENDTFYKVHNDLLDYNNSSWKNITTHTMKYTQDHIRQYHRHLKNEFNKEKYIVIKDPRLTFFVDFLKDVCEDKYDYYFLFLTRDKIECCNSLSKAQRLHIEKCKVLYDITMSKFSNDFLKINHREIILNNADTMKKISEFCYFPIIKNTDNIVDMKLYRNRNI